MAMLTGYFDAAGDNRGTHAVTVGGYLSSARAWARFEKRWRAALTEANIQEFHMTDFMAGAPPFEDWRGQPERQLALLRVLADVTRRNVHFSFASSVLLEDWRSANEGFYLKECRCTPYAIGAFTVMAKCIGWIGRKHRDDRFEFIFEEGDQGKGDFLFFVDHVIRKSHHQLARIRPVFKPKSCSPLQTADFVVWEQRRALRAKLEGMYEEMRPSFALLTKIPNDWGVVNRQQIAEWCAWLGVPSRAEQAPDVPSWRPAFRPRT